MTAKTDLFKGLVWLSIAIASWGALFSVAKRTLPVLDAFFLGSVRYAFGVLIFIAILWAVEGRQALRYGGRFAPAAVYGMIGFCGFNLLVWWGLAYTRPEHAAIIMALQTPMAAGCREIMELAHAGHKFSLQQSLVIHARAAKNGSCDRLMPRP